LLEKLIPAFANWHNNLLYQDKDHLQNDQLPESAGILAALLTQIELRENE
jgi:hypothetical protein